MASVSPSAISPPVLPQNLPDRSVDSSYSVQGRLPSHHLTNPRPSILSPPEASPQPASTRYVHQYYALMENQRRVFDEERELWHTERSELLAKIESLKTRLCRVEGASSSQLSSPTRKQASEASFTGFFGVPRTSQPRYTSTGDEFWRGAGGKSDAQPTRSFSDPPSQPSQIGPYLPSISESQSPQSRRSLLTDSIKGAAKPRTSVVTSGEDLDGIIFKTSSFASSSDVNIMTPQSPSPLRASPRVRAPPDSQLEIPIECNTVHAGHTPLARGSRSNTDGAASAMSSSPTTPTQPEIERPPHEPRASFVKPPTERSDSYFAGVSQRDSPFLNEPLSLGDRDSSETRSFLDAVDQKLEKAAKGEDKKSKDASSAGNSTGASSTPAKPAEELSEPEPKLRIKRSMNFGSQLGSLQ